jgi:hypothetical protein
VAGLEGYRELPSAFGISDKAIPAISMPRTILQNTRISVFLPVIWSPILLSRPFGRNNLIVRKIDSGIKTIYEQFLYISDVFGGSAPCEPTNKEKR